MTQENKSLLKYLFKPLIVIIITSAIYLAYYPTAIKNNSVKVVNLMYTFHNYEKLCYNNMPELEKMCTDEMVSKLTIKNKDLLETVYYRFRGFATEAVIEDVNTGINNSRVTFRIKNKMIADDRLFSLELKFNLMGKVSDVKLYEILKQYI